MKARGFVLIGLMMFFFLGRTAPAQAQFDKLFKNFKSILGAQELSEDKIVRGLKEALRVGAENAVDVVSQVNGYYKNARIRIPLPEPVKKVENVLRAVGYGSLVDDFEKSMNRAAERASPQAKELLWQAVRRLSFSDARKILNGRENEATLYLKDKTEGELGQTFKPPIHEAMAEVGVTKSFQQLNDKLRAMPLTNTVSFDLDQYVTDKALDGLFVMLAQEEKKIRQDPAARVTDLLKEVFGQAK